MQYIYKQLINKYNFALLSQINDAAKSLYNKLENIEIHKLNISEYNKAYLKEIFEKDIYYFKVFTYILYLALKNCKKPFSEISIVDYGGGTGSLSYLAFELGIGNIYYVDIFETSVSDARLIGEKISSKCANYIHGDIKSLYQFKETNFLEFDAIVSSNVIEHIYNLEYFIELTSNMCNDETRVIFSTSANIKNPIIRYRLKKAHRIDEFTDRISTESTKDSDTLLSHYKLRLEIIEQYISNQISNEEKQKLAKLTRGRIKDDILKLVDFFIATKKFPKSINHKTNTCDPFTGNWSERLVKHNYYKKLGVINNIKFKIIPAYYGANRDENKVINTIKSILNFKIKIIGKTGLYLAPYIIIYGTKIKN